MALASAVGEAGPAPEVVIEATWGWYWAGDVLGEMGCRVHLAHPLGVKGYQNRRVKNDDRDATLLADLLRMGSLPQGWIALRWSCVNSGNWSVTDTNCLSFVPNSNRRSMWCWVRKG